jgi:hypothetical protein
MIDQLDEANALLYAAKHYDNPQCFDTLEFYEDLSRFKYLKRLFKRYEETGELKERLIINHLTVIYNVFGPEAGTRLLFLKLQGFYSSLKPFLELMGYMPEVVEKIGIPSKSIRSEEIESDKKIEQLLREI